MTGARHSMFMCSALGGLSSATYASQAPALDAARCGGMMLMYSCDSHVAQVKKVASRHAREGSASQQDHEERPVAMWKQGRPP